jgi:hypothetical protein
VTIEGLDSAEQLLVVPDVDEDLRVGLYRLGEQGEGASVEFLLLILLRLSVSAGSQGGRY